MALRDCHVSRRRGRRWWRLGDILQRTKAAIIFFNVPRLSSLNLEGPSHSTQQTSVMMSTKVHEFLFIGAVAAATVRGSQLGISAVYNFLTQRRF